MAEADTRPGRRSRRYCPQCRWPMHRVRRSAWQHVVGFFVLARPLSCRKCGYSTWGLPAAREGLRPWLVNAWTTIAFLAAAVALGLRLVPQERAPVRIEEDSPAVAAITPPPPAPTVAPEPVAPVPEPPPAEPVENLPAYRPVHDLQVRRDDAATILELRSDRPVDSHQIVASGDTSRIVIDLPGRWRIVPGVGSVHTFGNGAIAELTLGQHPDFLRLVLRTRGRPPPAATVSPTPEGASIRIE